jgi:pimeloyl-ACP methyl ester carboxylesterase
MKKVLRRGVLGGGVIAILCLLLNSCFSRYILTDKEITEHYEQKDYKPVFHSLKYANSKIHYVEFGDTSKPLLVLIHGAPGAWYTWMNFIDNDSIRKNFHVLAIDRLGYGKSNYGKAEKDIMVQVCSIQSVIDEYPNKEINITGRSYGAPIAAALAAINDTRCKNLYLFSPVMSPYNEKMYWFSGLGKSPVINWMLPKALNVATAEKYAHLRQMKQLLGFYCHIKANTVIVAGDNDWVAHPSNYNLCDSLVCTAQKKKIYITNGDHFLTANYPNTMTSLIYKPFGTINEQQVNISAQAEIGGGKPPLMRKR